MGGEPSESHEQRCNKKKGLVAPQVLPAHAQRSQQGHKSHASKSWSSISDFRLLAPLGNQSLVEFGKVWSSVGHRLLELRPFQFHSSGALRFLYTRESNLCLDLLK